MSLLEVQRSLVGFARGSTAEYRNCNNLTNDENDWLSRILNSPGLQVTQQTQQWWRIARVCSAAPLTLALLKREGLEELLYEYITCQPVKTLFFAAELEQFNYFIQDHPQANSTIKTLVEFEFAIKNAYQSSVNRDQTKQGHNVALVIQALHFRCDPIKLLGSLLTGAALPLETQDYYVIVSPDLPQHWRPASREEFVLVKNNLYPNNIFPTIPTTNVNMTQFSTLSNTSRYIG